MGTRISELQCKEVICVGDGRRLGFISDVLVQIPEGTVSAVIVPGPCSIRALTGRRDDYCIPWSCICRIGPDIVLVDADPEVCRVSRPAPRWGR